MTYDEKHDELQNAFAKKFELFHKIDDHATNDEKQSETYLQIKEEFESINLEYQNFLMLFKGTNAKGCDEFDFPDDSNNG